MTTTARASDARRGGALVALLRSLDAPTPPPAVPDDDVPVLVEAIRHHCVAAVVQSIAPPALAAALATDAPHRFANQLASAADLAWLRAVVQERAASWVVLKGPDLAGFYPPGVQRDYSDLDVLVDRRDVPAVVDALTEAGCRLVGDPWAHLQESQRGQLLLRLPAGSLLDLHWELFNNPGVRRALPVSIPDLLGRRTQRHGLPTLDLADTAMFVAAHACLSGGYRLKWLLDVHRVLAAEAAWAEAAAQYASTPLALPLAVAADRATTVLGPLPGVDLRALPPSPWRSWQQHRQRASPVQDALGRRTGRTVTAATRGSTAGSVRALLRDSWGVQRHRSRSHEELPLGGPEQATFLAWVVTGG